ncbi:MAG: hypothetical protein JWO63_3121 [Frankiales bacterium]|nr:hypothetical protein [Frankiales bacterium]
MTDLAPTSRSHFSALTVRRMRILVAADDVRLASMLSGAPTRWTPAKHEVRRDHALLELSPREFSTLELLMRQLEVAIPL